MRFIQEYGYTVKVGMDEAHQRWLEENDAALKAAQPKGTRYIGTFVVILETGEAGRQLPGAVRTRQLCRDGRAAAANKDPKSELSRLLGEISKFFDLDLQAPWSQHAHEGRTRRHDLGPTAGAERRRSTQPRSRRR